MSASKAVSMPEDFFSGCSCNFVGGKGRWIVPYKKFTLCMRNQYKGCMVSGGILLSSFVVERGQKMPVQAQTHLCSIDHVWFPNKADSTFTLLL